jgi:hypothetical protein
MQMNKDQPPFPDYDVNAVERLGRDAGGKWAANIAECDELERIAEIDTNAWFAGEPMAPYSWGDYLAFTILGTSKDEQDSTLSQAFWRRAVGDPHDSRLASEKWLEGFIDGAADAYRDVEGKK